MAQYYIEKMNTYQLDDWIKECQEGAKRARLNNNPINEDFWVKTFKETLEERHKRGYDSYPYLGYRWKNVT
jgi:hypothetical protein